VSIVSITATGDHDRADAQQRRHRLPSGLLRLASDERLVELLRGGSEAAFEALYSRHHRGILSFCRHMLGSAEEAEDAVQHTFLAVYRDLLGSRKDVQLRPWLYAIARNRCLSVLRSRRERVDELAEPSTDHLSEEVERRHDLRALLGDLAELPDDQRAALVLAELGDLSHDEIGTALGCRREKVKALVFQARSSLIASRAARELPCEEVRQQLANLRGGALRRNSLRRHLRDCEGCREFQGQVQAQRRALALILPVAPSLGLKAAVLGGGAAASGSIAAKTLIVLAVAGSGVAAVETVREDRPPAGPDTARADGPRGAAPAAAVGAGEDDDAGTPRAVDPRPAKAQGPKERAARKRARRAKERPAKARGPKERPAKARGPKLVPPGRAERSEAAVPPGRANRAEKVIPPGQVKKAEKIVAPVKPDKVVAPAKPERLMPPGQAMRPDDGLPPGHAKKQ
jgi:RNA polymerase sigma factor (sigma-70 family)